MKTKIFILQMTFSNMNSDFKATDIKLSNSFTSINKQLLDEVEHDIMNYQNRSLCYLPKPKAEADNTDTRSFSASDIFLLIYLSTSLRELSARHVDSSLGVST